MDICSVWQTDMFLKYSVSMMGYGYFGDLLKESERFRWMGPKRYDYAGFKKFFGNRYLRNSSNEKFRIIGKNELFTNKKFR